MTGHGVGAIRSILQLTASASMSRESQSRESVLMSGPRIGGIIIATLCALARAPIVGGNWGNDVNAGLSYVNNTSLTNTNSNIGARLNYIGSLPHSYLRLTSWSNITTKTSGLVALKAKIRINNVGGDVYEA